MELINYLNEHFITKEQLLEHSKVTGDTLSELQHQGLMPLCSYRLRLNLESDSFLGKHTENQGLEYYAKGYISWLTAINYLPGKQHAYRVFSERYEATIKQLKSIGHSSANPKVNGALAQHIEQEWSHFLQGIYGLCTKSGLPEDIAAKELAILEINELLEHAGLDQKQLKRLERAVNLLDSASSLFAPHERLKSSRHRLVCEVRRQYQLPAQQV